MHTCERRLGLQIAVSVKYCRRGWATRILPAVKRADLALLENACKERLSRRALIDIRAGRSTPHRKNQEFLASVVLKLDLRDR
jgi:hypothetical protein